MWYPDYEWEEYDFDPVNAEPCLFQDDCLFSTYWEGWQFADPGSDEYKALPCEEPDGSMLQFTISIDEDGSGILSGLDGGDLSFTWLRVGNYSAILQFEDADVQGSIALYSEQGDNGEFRLWLLFVLDGMRIWFY